MLGFRAAVAFSVLAAGRSALIRKPEFVAEPCDAGVVAEFMLSTDVLRNDPGAIRSFMGDVTIKNVDGTRCDAETHEEKRFTSLMVTAFYEHTVHCCTDQELANFKNRIVDGSLSPWAKRVFGSMHLRDINGVDFYEVEPDACTDRARCPLVIEISGNGGNPWAMTLISCDECNQEMGVVMIAPVLGSAEETGSGYVKNTILPWVSAYIKQATKIDTDRVYIASVSRGNEIALQAAIYGAHLFQMALMTGKFKISGEFQAELKDPGVVEAAAHQGLKNIIFKIGDQDDILPDEEFYSNFSGLFSAATMAETAPLMELHIYQGAGHDLTFTAWEEMYSVLWTANANP